MWTESRYPNNAAPMARPLLSSVASPGRARTARAAQSSGNDGPCVHATRLVLTSGGKVTPADGQEHPRTEL